MPPFPTAPKRQRVLDFVTPDVGDLLFYEIVEGFRSAAPEYGTPHPDTVRWPHHIFVFAAPADEGGSGYRYYYAARREEQDRYNFEFSESSLGGSAFDTITRTYINLRSEFDPYGQDAPKAGDSMPAVPDARFGGDFVFLDREQARINDQRLDSMFVLERRKYIRRVTTRSIGTDSVNGKPLTEDVFAYYGTEEVPGTNLTMAGLMADPGNAFWGLRADGTEASGRRLSDNWYEVSIKQVVGGTLVDGVLVVQSFQSNSSHYWPPVLETFELLDWQRRDGGTDVYPAIRFNPEGYNGPCLTQITRTWSPSPFTVSAVEPMQPTRIYYGSPFYSLNISECLHGDIVAQCDIGNTDPVYGQNVGSGRLFPATNFTEWPESIIADDDQEPFRGGYMRTVRTVFPPVVDSVGGFTPPP